MIRYLFAALTIAAASYLGYTAITIGVSRTILRYYADSAHLKQAARLTPADPLITERLSQIYLFDPNQIDLPAARDLIQQAINHSPYDYRHWIVKARVAERMGEQANAEAALTEAVKLAPNYFVPGWELANLRLRRGDLARATAAFREVLSNNPDQISYTLDLIWQITEDVESLKAVIPDTGVAHCQLSEFLMKKGYWADSWAQLQPLLQSDRLGCPETAPALVEGALAAGRYEIAWEVWRRLPEQRAQAVRPQQVYNGDFVIPITKKGAGFDWSFSDYAQVTVQRDQGPTNESYSLKIAYQTAATEALEHARQTVLVEPGRRYRLVFQAKADALVSAALPKIVISELNDRSRAVLASVAIKPGAYQWQPYEVSFTANSGAVLVSIRREPECPAGEPCAIAGTLWLSKFSLTTETQR